MLVSKIDNNQNFNGKLVVKGAISTTQNYLFGLHRKNLERMIADKPYDLFVRQSKSKRSIAISTDKNFKSWYFVRKNEQDFERKAEYAINSKDSQLEEETKINQELGKVYLENKHFKNFFNLF